MGQHALAKRRHNSITNSLEIVISPQAGSPSALDMATLARRVYKRIQWIRRINRPHHTVHVADETRSDTARDSTMHNSTGHPAVALTQFQLRLLGELDLEASMSLGVDYMDRNAIALHVTLGGGDDVVEGQLAHVLCHALQHSRRHFSGYFSQAAPTRQRVPAPSDVASDSSIPFSSTYLEGARHSQITLDELTARVAAVEGECLHVAAEYIGAYLSTTWPITLYDPAFIGANLRLQPSLMSALRSWGYVYYHRHRQRHGWKKLNHLYTSPPKSSMNFLYPGLGRSVAGSSVSYQSIDQLREYRLVGTDRVGPAILFQLIAKELGAGRATRVLSGWKSDIIAGFDAPGPLFPAPLDEAMRPLSFLHRSEWRSAAEARSFSDAMGFFCERDRGKGRGSTPCIVRREDRSVVWAYGLPESSGEVAADAALKQWHQKRTKRKRRRRTRKKRGRRRT